MQNRDMDEFHKRYAKPDEFEKMFAKPYFDPNPIKMIKMKKLIDEGATISFNHLNIAVSSYHCTATQLLLEHSSFSDHTLSVEQVKKLWEQVLKRNSFFRMAKLLLLHGIGLNEVVMNELLINNDEGRLCLDKAWMSIHHDLMMHINKVICISKMSFINNIYIPLEIIKHIMGILIHVHVNLPQTQYAAFINKARTIVSHARYFEDKYATEQEIVNTITEKYNELFGNDKKNSKLYQMGLTIFIPKSNFPKTEKNTLCRIIDHAMFGGGARTLKVLQDLKYLDENSKPTDSVPTIFDIKYEEVKHQERLVQQGWSKVKSYD